MNLKKKVIIIDLGLGNIGSIHNALLRLNCEVSLLKEPPTRHSTKIYTHTLLPGVGSFAFGMKAIESKKWDLWIKEEWNILKKPFLGICLGMQMMASYGSEGCQESEWTKGLDLIPGKVIPLNISKDLCLPHIGWNSINWKDKSNLLCSGLNLTGDYYFVHSFFFKNDSASNCVADCNYGCNFSAVIAKDNNYGVQFHPEKSQGLGKKILSNFLLID